MNITAIILVAGYSSRMGRFKPLLEIDGKTIMERGVCLFRDAGVQDIRVVVGYRSDLLEPLLEQLDVRIIPNPLYDEGMFSSVTAALQVLDKNVEAFFILPADIPLINPLTVSHLLDFHRYDPEKILVPCFMNRRGHPVLIPSIYREMILAWRGGGGLKGALGWLGHRVFPVEVDDRNILFDCDTPEDYEDTKTRFTLC
jgi:molybdenum cofactor cytidylyltransferase